MARRNHTELSLDTLTLEGALFMPDLLEKASLGEAAHQRPADYQIPKGLTLQDEYGRAFQIACAQFKTFAPALERQDLDPFTATRTYTQEFLHDVLGYDDWHALEGHDIDGRVYPITAMARGRVSVVIAPHDLGLDDPDARYAVTGLGSRKKSAARLAQEFLDASTACTWALVTNGRRIRLMRDAATLTRPTYLEFDLETILTEKRYPDFKALWRILHASRAGVPDTPGHDCIWERWRLEGQSQGNRVREGLRNGVTAALLTLGEGFLAHPANEALRKALEMGSLRGEAYFQQLLRLVYRFLFLFTVEERDGILHPHDESPAALAARQVYAEGYSMRRLRERAMRRSAHDTHDDLWQAVRIVFKGLATGEPRLALPALGGLFAPGQCPHLDASALANHALLAAMQSLRWSVIDGVLSPVDYRNRGFEELGSVYESLLELVPDIDLAAKSFGFVGLENIGAGHERKSTGSYYTPDSLVQELIRSALDPVIEARLAAKPENPAEALLSITVIDPACGSGHFLLAAARRLAEKLAELQAVDGNTTPAHYRHALREVIKRCIHGVDKNPLALELARTALWLDGFEPGRALSFLDHHLVCGDGLVGLIDLNQVKDGIPDAAFKPLSGDDKAVCQVLAKTNKAGIKRLELYHGQDIQAPDDWRDALARHQAVEDLPDDTPEQCAVKEQAWAASLRADGESPLAHAADIFVGALLAPKDKPEAVNTTPSTADIMVARFGTGRDAEHEMRLELARRLCHEARIMHWPLAFPHIFTRGGFDCVLANPPWERIKLLEEEFFATRHPLVAQAKNKAERGQRIAWLAQGMLARHIYPDLNHAAYEAEDEKLLYAEFITARRTAEAASLYAHLKDDEGGRFPLTGVGDVNTYALFAETISRIVKKDGRAGFIVPSGIATDDSTKAFFAYIAGSGRLVSLFDFENREKIFPDVDSRQKLCLLTLGTSAQARFSFFLTQTEQMISGPRLFTLSPEDFQRINPNTRTCPIFRSQADAELTKKIYARAPVLIREAQGEEPEANPWDIRFMAMFHMSNDSHIFTGSDCGEHLRLYEAKMIHQFDHRWASYQVVDGQDEAGDVPLAHKQDPGFGVRPRYWVRTAEVLARIADAPKALCQAYVAGDAALLLLAFANWVEACYEEELGLTAHKHAAKTLPELAGPLFAALPRDARQWRNAKAQAEARTHAPLSTDELSILKTARDIHEAAAIIMDRRSPRWLMGWRDICRATDERTVIASVLPRAGVGNNLPLMLFERSRSTDIYAALLANLTSLVLDFIARHKVGGTHLNYFIAKQLPVLPPDAYTATDLSFIVPRVLELTYTSHDLKPWAEDLGYTGSPFGFDPERRALLRAELDAWYARLYGLNCDELLYILDPADVLGPDYPSETFRVLKKNEEAAFGEYRTRRLVLEAWDRIEKQDSLTLTPADLTDIQKTIRETSYPGTELDKTICGIALAVLGKGNLDSMNHLYAVLLASHPSWCKAFLDDHDRKEFDRICARGPRTLRTDITRPVQWKKSRDYLERLKAITVDRSNMAQTLILADLSIPQVSFPGPSAEYMGLVMKALATMLDMKQGLVSQNQEQKAAIQILDQQQALENALAA